MKTLRSRAGLAATFLIVCCSVLQTVMGQHLSPHAINQSPYADTSLHSEADADQAYGIRHTTNRTQSKKCILQKQVYGWHPYWCGTTYQRYDFALLSTVAYFSYEVDPTTGNYHTIHQWRETGLVEMAHLNGSRVELTASLSGPGNTARFLGDKKACQTLCDSLVTLIQAKKADGICIDFRNLSPQNSEPFADCMDSLAARLHRYSKDATLSIVLYPETADQAYAYTRLSKSADRFLIAVTPLHDANAKAVGPISPLHKSNKWGMQSFEGSIQHLLAAGISKQKLLPTVPYFGYEWPMANAGTKPNGKGKLVTLREYEALDSTAHLQWDSASTTGWLPRVRGNQTHQLWIDQVSSLTEKYALIKQMDLAGVAIWALGYDHPYDKYWDLLRGQFADCGPTQNELTPDTNPTMPGMDGQTSAERNVWNWVWMLGGGIIAIAIILLVKKYM